MYACIYIYTHYINTLLIYITHLPISCCRFQSCTCFQYTKGQVKQGKFPMVTGYCSMSTLLSSSMQRRHTFWNHGGLVTTLGSTGGHSAISYDCNPKKGSQVSLRMLRCVSAFFSVLFFPCLGCFNHPASLTATGDGTIEDRRSSLTSCALAVGVFQ